MPRCADRARLTESADGRCRSVDASNRDTLTHVSFGALDRDVLLVERVAPVTPQQTEQVALPCHDSPVALRALHLDE